MNENDNGGVVQFPFDRRKGMKNNKLTDNVTYLPSALADAKREQLSKIMQHTSKEPIPKPQYGKFLSFERTGIQALAEMPNDDPIHGIMKDLDDEMHFINEIGRLDDKQASEFAQNILKAISAAFEYGQFTQLLEPDDEY